MASPLRRRTVDAVNVQPDWKRTTPGGIGKPKPLRSHGFRKVATREEWAEIVAAKQGVCRLCGRGHYRITYHHLVPRSLGGDDVADNIVPLCGSGTTGCHGEVEARRPIALKLLLGALSDAEYAYCKEKMAGRVARLFGV